MRRSATQTTTGLLASWPPMLMRFSSRGWQGRLLFGLDPLMVLERGDLQLRTLQPWQVLHFNFESAHPVGSFEDRE